ncbi:DUF4012 domain-containing protein [Demequina mangrovi]|uniref:DUF4012 domain-containing protein n=1 Tax=Demequina mangrovi TaxID=1043493 RepID=A0A1H6YHQ0_9MICO|nr:DUF4012 domain-containing protein [Demequina mangrovi]SEJ40791.1 Protein of unknown function [Demequina mangrovi]
MESGRRRVPWRWVATGMVVSVLVCGGLMVWDAWHAYRASEDLSAHAVQARDALLARDADGLRAEVGALQDAAHRLDGATDGPLWGASAVLPWIGDQVQPVQAIARASVAVADDALGPLAELADLDALAGPSIVDGRFDPYLLEPAREPLGRAAATLLEQSEVLGAVPLAGAVEILAEEYREAADQVTEMAALVDGAHRAATLMPTMLGGQEKRTYLVMVQNNAEPRATGGITGVVLELTVDDGRLASGRFVPARALVAARDASAVDSITDEEEQAFTARMAVFPQDANFTPEFPRAAQLISTFWTRVHPGDVDGVLAVDPVALGYLLSGVAPIEVDGVMLDSQSLAATMLNSAYSLFEDAEEQDEFFAEAASAIFDAIIAGAPGISTGIERGIDERRVLLWSAHDAEQKVLAGSAIAGTFFEDDAFGVFLNDGSGSKIGYYVDTAVDVADRVCKDGAVVSQEVTVTLTHAFDGDVAELPDYVAGGTFVDAGEFHANLMVVPSPGMRVLSAREGGEAAWVATSSLEGRSVVSTRVVLLPGEEATYTFETDAIEGAVPAGDVVVTPGARTAVVERTEREAVGC